MSNKQIHDPIQCGDGEHRQHRSAQRVDNGIFRVAAELVGKGGGQTGGGHRERYEHTQNNALPIHIEGDQLQGKYCCGHGNGEQDQLQEGYIVQLSGAEQGSEGDGTQLHTDDGHRDGGHDIAEVIGEGLHLGDILGYAQQIADAAQHKGHQHRIEKCLFHADVFLVAGGEIGTQGVHQHVVDDVQHDQHGENRMVRAKHSRCQRNAQKAVIGKHRAEAHHTGSLFVFLHLHQGRGDEEHKQNHGDADQRDYAQHQQGLCVKGQLLHHTGEDHKGQG